MDTGTFIIYDNRLLNKKNLDVESSIYSFQRNSLKLIYKILLLSEQHSKWLNLPLGILVDQNGKKSKLIKQDSFKLKKFSELELLLEPISKNNNSDTWSSYFVDCIDKIIDFLNKNKKNQENNIVIIILSNNILLFGDEFSISEENLITFIKNVLKLMNLNQKNKIEIKITNTIVSSFSISGVLNSYYQQIEHTLKSLLGEDIINISTISNTSAYYEDELRSLIQIFIPKLISKLEMPPFEGMRSSLSLQLIATTYPTADFIHQGLLSPSLFSLVNRNGIDPICLDGKAFVVIPAREDACNGKVYNEKSYHYNVSLFRSLMKLLAEKDTIIILTVLFDEKDIHYSFSKTPIESKQYWALIPPSSSSIIESNNSPNELTLIKLTDKDSTISISRSTRKEPIIDENSIDFFDNIDYLNGVLDSIGSPSSFNPFICSSGSLENYLEYFGKSTLIPNQNTKIPQEIAIQKNKTFQQKHVHHSNTSKKKGSQVGELTFQSKKSTPSTNQQTFNINQHQPSSLQYMNSSYHSTEFIEEDDDDAFML